MAKSIPEIITTLLALPKEAQQELLNDIAAAHGPLEAPPKPEPTPVDLEAQRAAKIAADDAEKARVANEKKRIEVVRKEILGSLNTLGSEDMATAKAAIAANVGVHVTKTSNIPVHESYADYATLPSTELKLRAEAKGIAGFESMSDKEIMAALVKFDEGKRTPVVATGVVHPAAPVGADPALHPAPAAHPVPDPPLPHPATVKADKPKK